MALDRNFLDSLVAVNQQNGIVWQAGPTSILHLSPAERKARLGYVPGPDEPTLADRERIAAIAHQALGLAKAGKEDVYPGTWDWRNANGDNYISRIKDQGNCGSCVAFGVAAALEGTARVVRMNPVNSAYGSTMKDLSEAQLFYCGAEGQQGRSCATGWWPDGALSYARTTGVAPGSYFRYEAGDQPCQLATGWQEKLTQLRQSAYLATPTEMKLWLATRGPLIAAFSVYADFYGYSSGVYRYNGSAPLEGGHCICVIGYDDNEQAWLCKNSWGTGWGSDGYFYIAYGQCGIDSGMWAISSFSRIEDSQHPLYLSAGPSAIVSNGKIYCFYQGVDSNGRVLYSVFDGGEWSGQIAVGNTAGMSSGPGAIVFNGEIYCFYQGVNNNGRVLYNIFNGNNWSREIPVGNTAGMSSGPSAIVFEGKIYCFYQGVNNNGRVLYNAFDGNGWSGETSVGNTAGMSSGPSAIIFQNKIYCFYQGVNNNGRVLYNVFDGNNWSGELPVGNTGGMSSGPGAVVFGGKIYVFYSGVNGNGQFLYNVFDGNAWTGEQHVPNTAGISSRPSAAILGNKLYCFHQGVGDNGQLWFSEFDGINWSGDKQALY